MLTDTYCQVDGHVLTMNVFLPNNAGKPSPAMVEIHGGWFVGGEPMTSVPSEIASRGAAFFSIRYRLGAEGGFPECIRDCRNAIRYIRKNATRFHIDPKRIAVMGGSAGGYLSLMMAMAPERFDDGGPTPELRGVSASVCGAFAWIPPTDFEAFWQQGPSDVVGNGTYRPWNDSIPNDARPHLRFLFHGLTPETSAGAALYHRFSPVNLVRKGLPPMLICDGAHDPIVPGQEGQVLYQRLRAAGDDAVYWVSNGGHEYPSGQGFPPLLAAFLTKLGF